ncbi:MAG: lmo0937 family membrane protein [Desulfobacterales bacterium]
MLWTIAVILLILWVLGLFSGHTMGGALYILLVVGLIVAAVQIIQGRRRG